VALSSRSGVNGLPLKGEVRGAGGCHHGGVDLGRAWLGLAYLMLGAALFVAFGLLTLGLMSPLLAPDERLPPPVVVTLGAVLGLALVLVVGAIPVVRRIEGVAVEGMLGVDFGGPGPGSADRWSDRLRSVAWLWAHMLAGSIFVGCAVTVPSLGLEASGWLVIPGFVLTIAAGLLLAAAVRRAAPALLGPSAHERIVALEREARELGERNRIAREIHDSVGHALSLVGVQAAAAGRVFATDPAFAAEALTSIEEAARRASAELDHALGVLRAEKVEGAERGRGPDLSDLPDLVAATSRAGLGTTLENRLSPADEAALSPVVARELYRLAQEGLANAIRHGAAPCHVLVDRADREVRLEISNALGGSPGTLRGPRRGGRGLPGMAARAGAIGGTASAGPADGEWVVRVSLPWVGAR